MNYNYQQQYPQGYAPENRELQPQNALPHPQSQYAPQTQPYCYSEQFQPKSEHTSSSQSPLSLSVSNTTPAHSNNVVCNHPHYRMQQVQVPNTGNSVAHQNNSTGTNVNAAPAFGVPPQINGQAPVACYQNQTRVQTPSAFHRITTPNAYNMQSTLGLASQQPNAHDNMTSAPLPTLGGGQPQPRSYSSLALQIMEKQEVSVRNGMMPASFVASRTVSSLSASASELFVSARSTPDPGYEIPLELIKRNASVHSFPFAITSPLPAPFVNRFETAVRVQNAPADYTRKTLILADRTEGSRNGVEVSQPNNQPLNLTQPSSVATIFARPTTQIPDEKSSSEAMDLSVFGETEAAAPAVVFSGPRQFNPETGFKPINLPKRPELPQELAAPSVPANQPPVSRQPTSTNSNSHLQQGSLEANFQQNVQDRQNPPQPLVVGGHPAQNQRVLNGNTRTNMYISGGQQPCSGHQGQILRDLKGNRQFNSLIQPNQSVPVCQVNVPSLPQVPFNHRENARQQNQQDVEMSNGNNQGQQQEEMYSEMQQPLQVTRAVVSIPKVVGDFKGISYLMNEGGYSDMLVDRLESNYMKSRAQVYNPTENGLMTPSNFLKKLGEEVETNLHTEKFRFKTDEREVQFRIEVYFGRFCGVAHAETYTTAVQLAAAHVLERLRIYFRPEGLDSKNYAMYPGCRYMKVEKKLVSLCNQYSLGPIFYDCENKKRGNYFLQGPKYSCSCIVANQKSVVRTDNTTCGNAEAAARLYKGLTSSCDDPSLKLVQLKDYFAIGAECPTLNQIHARIFLHPPAENKREWMKENKVSDTDLCLHDPTNASGYLDDRPVWKNSEEPLEFKRKLEEAIVKIKSTFQANNPEAERNCRDMMMNARSGLGRSVGGFGRHLPLAPVDERVESSDAMEEGEVVDQKIIFHDADCMDDVI
ncbi:hypothetical protein Ocin01_08327 [Orchesella cincta]|uniref:Uncharacterized protein n=1 Tax=Orchesella cincta TaxID=48709 RepID=A0A1D2MZV6_ORCCI|nr:hypothetical protein Ocin01_08327 [Orchesella cincta]